MLVYNETSDKRLEPALKEPKHFQKCNSYS